MHLRFLTTPIAQLARIFLCGVLLLSTLAGAAGAVTDLDSLAEMRARRRAAIKKVSLAADKSGEAGLFGLLVIPVDFADARLPDSWNPDELTSRISHPY